MGGSGSGRKKGLTTELRIDVDDYIDKNLKAYIGVVSRKALQGDVNCAVYLIDRRLGRPSLSVDSRIKQDINLSSDDLWEAVHQARQSQKEIIDAEVLPERNNE